MLQMKHIVPVGIIMLLKSNFLETDLPLRCVLAELIHCCHKWKQLMSTPLTIFTTTKNLTTIKRKTVEEVCRFCGEFPFCFWPLLLQTQQETF